MEQRKISDKDQKTLLLIPGGSYRMGSQRGYAEERPVHTVPVNPFYMDEKPVTNAEYLAFCEDTGRPHPDSPRWADCPHYFEDYPDHPVVNVSWEDAAAYAAWAGKRLPTEAEWEYAAAGGLDAPLYPWGDEAPDGTRANFADKNSDFPWKDPAQDDGYKYTSPVGSYSPNGYGLYDMAGNVAEWVEDWFFDYADTQHDTEKFKDGWGGSRLCRGGCYHSTANDLRIARRRQLLAGSPQEGVGFRCAADPEGVAHQVRDVVNYLTSPEGWDEKLEAMRVRLPEGQELCIGIGVDEATPGFLRKLRNMGVTSVEQYVTWETVENAGEDQWDFSHWDGQVQAIRAAGLKWLPFFIAGPAYSLPDWYRTSREFEGCVCLEHNLESKIQSFWDKNFYRYVDRFLKKLSEHYSDSSLFEGILLGISGDFGEAIVSDWHGIWPTKIPGLYHAHAGYWCNDRFARADFSRAMREKFSGDLERLNASWGTGYKSFEAVAFPHVASAPDNFRVDEHTGPGAFLPQSTAERRQWVDFIDWYRQSMTDYAAFWMQTARKYFPDTEIYLCTGGNAAPNHGAEFAAQSKISAQVGGGVRITNEASNYEANFVFTNWVSTASAFYGGIFSFEPAGQVTERGVVCRVYNAAATGAKSLHYYSSNIMGNEERALNFAGNVHFLKEGGVRRNIALLYPDTPLMLEPRRYREMEAAFMRLRDYTDYGFASDLTIQDGYLDTISALLLPVGGYYKTETLRRIEAFALKGGLLVGLGLSQLRDLDEDLDYLPRLFGDGPRALGAGHSLMARALPQDRTGAQDVLDQVSAFLAQHGVFVSDGQLDQVYTAHRDGQLLVLNYSGQAVSRQFTRPDGSPLTAELPDLTIQSLSLG